MIEVTNLVKRYGNHTAVDRLSFTVEDGQIYGFLGPNGAGKSTTMNIMTGYIAATEGQVLINGHDILEEPAEAKKCIGYLPELPPLYMDMTVREYLKFVAELKKLPKKEHADHIAEVMETVKITDMADRLIKNLSKGYRQRVGLAQAIIGYPEIIILDEPTVGLDPKQIIEIRDLIRSLGKKHTVILSSHILSEVSAVCDQIMIISKGKLVANDTPEKLSEMASGTTDIHLEIKGDRERVKAAIKSCGFIDYIEVNSYQKDTGCGVYTVHVQENQDIREEIFYKMADIKAPILEMSISRKSLEDVFLELTKDEAVSRSEKKAKRTANGAENETASEDEAGTDETSGDEAGADETSGDKAGTDEAAREEDE
ncbi:MAG: ABC transporter ATP-binding protein [Lachnospiraceae bacterium]|nr:ABC transporter ATP-binding protein [Lachnospiraceae bacterium]